jgi:hypothetical protein
VSLTGKLVHNTNENTMLIQDVAYLTSCIERTRLSEKMIQEDLSRVDECVTYSIRKLGLGYERCEDKGEISTKFVPSSTYKDEEETLKHKQISYPPNTKPSFNPKRVQNQTTNPSMTNLHGVYMCMFCVHVGHLDEFCFRRKRIEKRRVDYARKTHILMSSLIFWLIFTLVLYLTLLLMLCLISLMDLTIAHMVLVLKKIALCLDALVAAHILIVVIIFHVGLVFLLEGLTLALSPNTWTVQVFPSWFTSHWAKW